jgi:hypothetical protein
VTNETTPAKRPAILDEIMGEIDETSRKDGLVKAKRNLEDQVMELLANVRLQEDIVDQKEQALDDLPDGVDKPTVDQLENGLRSARLILEDRYQGAAALARELKRVNAALEEIKTAGLAAFDANRAGRRAKGK